MATIFSHALVGSTIVTLSPQKYRSSKIYVLGALTAALPDIDYLGFVQRIPYESLWGHRGMTHSLLFAFGIAIIVAFWANKKINKTFFGFLLLFFVTTASHSCLDAFTNGGLGVAFYAPYNTARYFFPWRPIQVSPLGLGFFSEKGLVVLLSELYWIAIPCGLIFLLRALIYKADSRRGQQI